MFRHLHNIENRPSIRRSNVIQHEIAITSISLPFLLFPTIFQWGTVASLCALAFTWIRVYRKQRLAWPASPYNGALVILATSLFLNVIAIPVHSETLRKITVIILGFALFRLILLSVNRFEDIRWAYGAFFLLSLGSMALSLLAVQWPQKVPWLSSVAAHLSHPLLRMPEVASGYVNPNQLAVVPVMFIPVVLSLLWSLPHVSSKTNRVLSGLLMVNLLFASLLLLFTQSRFGWAGGAAGVAIYFVFSRRRTFMHKPRIVVMSKLFTILGGTAIIARMLMRWSALSHVLGTVDLDNRLEIWGHSVEAMRYVPFTGLGLGTYHEKVPFMIPFSTMSVQTGVVWDAHNTLLQVGMDLGILGIIAYVVVFIIAFYQVLAIQQTAFPPMSDWAAGVLGSLMGVTIYGVGNAVNLGSKPMILVWILLGILQQLYVIGSSTIALQHPGVERGLSGRILVRGMALLFGVLLLLRFGTLTILLDVNTSTVNLIPDWVAVYTAEEIPHCSSVRSAATSGEEDMTAVHSVEKLTVLGWQMWVQGYCKKAEAAWKRALNLNPHMQASAWGLIWLGKQRFVFESGALDPYDVALYAYHRGEFLEATHKDWLAMDWYIYALNTDPHVYEAAIGLDRIYTRQGRAQEQEAMWRWLKQTLSPDEPGYWWAVARLAELHNDLLAAERAYRRGEALAAGEERARFTRKRRQLQREVGATH